MKVWKEPLVQFLALGGLLYIGYATLAPEPEAPRERIVVDERVVTTLELTFENIWNRTPTNDERTALIEDFITEEIFYREAKKMGLDGNDVIIRRRLRQKLEFLLQDGLSQADPSDTALQAFFEENADRYAGETQLSFRQILLDETDDASVSAVLEMLNGPNPPASDDLGRLTMLPGQIKDSVATQIDSQFGRGFSDNLTALEVGKWDGPVQSGFGVHLVIVDAARPTPAPQFGDVRNAVVRDYQANRTQQATRELVERLKQEYDIVYEAPGS